MLIRHLALLRFVRTWTVRLLVPRRFRKAVALYKAAIREELWTPMNPSVAKMLETYFPEHQVRGGHLRDPDERYIQEEFRKQGMLKIQALYCCSPRTIDWPETVPGATEDTHRESSPNRARFPTPTKLWFSRLPWLPMVHVEPGSPLEVFRHDDTELPWPDPHVRTQFVTLNLFREHLLTGRWRRRYRATERHKRDSIPVTSIDVRQFRLTTVHPEPQCLRHPTDDLRPLLGVATNFLDWKGPTQLRDWWDRHPTARQRDHANGMLDWLSNRWRVGHVAGPYAEPDPEDGEPAAERG